MEDAFQSVPGVCDAESGYTGGTVPNPTYEQVCTGRTGHAEAVRVTYDPAKVSFEELARLFFEIHDPTQINRQGPDIGTQYRSAIFYKDERQKATALSLMEKLREHGYAVATELLPASAFYPAEAYHQDFTARTAEAAAISACSVSGYEQKNKEPSVSRLKGGRKGSSTILLCNFMQ